MKKYLVIIGTVVLLAIASSLFLLKKTNNTDFSFKSSGIALATQKKSSSQNHNQQKNLPDSKINVEDNKTTQLKKEIAKKNPLYTKNEIKNISADTHVKPGAFADPAVRAAFVAAYKKRDDKIKKIVQNYSEKHNIPIRGEDEEGPYVLHGLDSNGRPIKCRPLNDEAAIISRVAAVRGDEINGAGAKYGLTGNGLRAYIFEDGSPDINHEAFYKIPGNSGSGSRIFHQSQTYFDPHAAHVSGTVSAGFNSNNGNATGMAPESELANRYIHDYSYAVANGATSSVPASGGIVANNSYSDISSQGSYYGSTSRNYDSTMYGLRYFLLFSAAGNGNNSARFDMLYNVSKNGMNVAACDEAITDRQLDMSKIKRRYSSGMGPCDDGRIKPDITANGTGLTSVGSGTTGYRGMSGTSMSSPSAAGSAIIIQEMHANLNSGNIMIAALLKGLIIHTATDIKRLDNDTSKKEVGQDGPDFTFGWGLFNALAACDKIYTHHNDPTNLHLTEATLLENSTNKYSFVWDGSSPIRATIAWTDPAGTAKNNEDTTPVLVNDLDIRIYSPSNDVYFPYKFDDSDPNYPDIPATTGDNIVDNVEQIYIKNPGINGVWSIEISHKNSLTDGKQEFGLIVDGQRVSGNEISVSANGNILVNGEPTPLVDNHTDFESVAYNLGADLIHHYKISNIGDTNLIVKNVAVDDMINYSITQPADTNLAPGESTSFSLTYAPTDSGIHDAVVTVFNDDADETNFTFNITGEGVSAAIISDISLRKVLESSSAPINIKLNSRPPGDVTVNLAISGDADLTLPLSTFSFNITNWDTFQTVNVSAAEDSDKTNGMALFTASATNWTDAVVSVFEIDNDSVPIVMLHLDEFSGAPADNSGTLGDNGDGTFYGNISRAVPGVINFGVWHDGSDDYMKIANNSALDFNSENDFFAVSIWFKYSNSTGSNFKQLIGKSKNKYSNCQFLIYLRNNSLYGKIGNATTAALGANLNDDSWHLVTLVNNPIDENLTIYLDDAAIFKTKNHNSHHSSYGAPIHVGALTESGNPSEFYNGYMDEIIIYDRPVSTTEIADRYNSVMLTTNTPPTISNISDTSINEDTPTAPLPFSITDNESESIYLMLEATSSNQLLVSDLTGFSFGGSGSNRTITVTPLENASGITEITVIVKDPFGKSNSNSFMLTVNALSDDPPVVNKPIPDLIVGVNTNFSFQFSDSAFTDPDGDSLVYSAILADGTDLPTWLNFSSASRTFSGIPPAEYILDVKVIASDGSNFVFDIFKITIKYFAVLENFDSDPGWNTEGDWAFGVPTGGGGQYGYPDPLSGYSGSNVYGYNLSGDYGWITNKTLYLTTPPIDCSEVSNATLSFQRWLGVNRWALAKTNIQISDDGVNWVDVWANGNRPITDDEWTNVLYDVSAVADKKNTVYIRWGMGTTYNFSFYCGWNIDDIKLYGDSKSLSANIISPDQKTNAVVDIPFSFMANQVEGYFAVTNLQWNFGDGSINTNGGLQLTNIVHSYTIEGIYTTVFSVADSGGFGAEDSVEIEVIPEPGLLWIIGLIPLLSRMSRS